MKTHSFKRWIAGLLSAALCLSAFLGLGITKVFAKGEQAEVCLVSFPREGDANYSTTTWGHDDIKLMNGWFFQKGKYLTVYSMGSYNGKICYCIEPSTMVKSGDRLSSTNETYWDNYPDKYNNRAHSTVWLYWNYKHIMAFTEFRGCSETFQCYSHAASNMGNYRW